MSKYFALVNSENIVEKVIVAEDEFVDALPDEAGKQWIQTFMSGENGKNYAGIGFSYIDEMNDFMSPKPYPSWVQNGHSWEAPVPMPSVGDWNWDENTVSWVALGLPQ